MKAMKDAVLATAKTLAKANNTVTTLEIKTELRRDYPYYFWTQDIVSNYMDQLAGDGTFKYTDNGTYRTYRLVPKPATKAKAATKFSVPTSTSVFGKVSGTIATKASKPAARTKFKKGGTVNRSNVVNLLAKGNFNSVTFDGSGFSTITPSDIKIQKKSVTSYITRRIKNLTSINVAGVTYRVV